MTRASVVVLLAKPWGASIRHGPDICSGQACDGNRSNRSGGGKSSHQSGMILRKV
jgi:hypothetical protein